MPDPVQNQNIEVARVPNPLATTVDTARTIQAALKKLEPAAAVEIQKLLKGEFDEATKALLERTTSTEAFKKASVDTMAVVLTELARKGGEGAINAALAAPVPANGPLKEVLPLISAVALAESLVPSRADIDQAAKQGTKAAVQALAPAREAVKAVGEANDRFGGLLVPAAPLAERGAKYVGKLLGK